MKNITSEVNIKYNLLQLENKVCIITGAASLRSIGYGTAELFAAHGAKLVILDIVMNEQIAKDLKNHIETQVGKSVEILCLTCDIRNINDCENAIEKSVAHFGTIDCLVNCAGIVKSEGMLSITEQDYDLIMDVNLKGTFNICKSVLKVFAEKQAGVIINLASLAAQRGGGLVGGAHYAASKGGVISLTRSIAREFAPLGIRANVICPAMIETNMLDGLTEAQLNEVIAAIPLKRVGKTIELAGTCLFLASDLSGFTTGATIDVNGGIHIH
ncbi:SDR family NAD(P)-dependent oxidoreductase [Runella aurantiaca]|uniref:SDR family NAD(P)-dependent oxidoreductase n=1 Tax=Runella aurantiaca TaxID=2282308 RepID=A0A369I259_9BACT|nr:SDR family oxidoreductase [Runella aurantiaca]RDB02567.1 SDR family NAD(P)-dependent oxidoreductase [Runella aurantiaca]